MSLTNQGFTAFEMLLFLNAYDLPPASLDLEPLQEVLLETPRSAQGVISDSPPSPALNPPGLLPQVVAAPADDRTSACAVHSASISLPPPIPPPQDATSLPPNWHKILQEVYKHGGKQWDYTSSESISFKVTGCPGMNIRDALQKRFTGLEGRDDLVLQDAGNVVSCRLKFPGCPPNGSIQVGTLILVVLSHNDRDKKISTKHWGRVRDPISRSHLAYQVAKRIKQYLEDMAVSYRRGWIARLVSLKIEPQQGPHGSTPWKLDNMFLAQLESVSKGSWQPQLWVVDSTL